jgi:hypothetical protein
VEGGGGRVLDDRRCRRPLSGASLSRLLSIHSPVRFVE